MSSHNEDTARLRQIDRLAAGDLAEPQRRELLAWFDQEPARWRQCGLAFLEAQAWGEAFAADGMPAAAPDCDRARRPDLTCRVDRARQHFARMHVALAAALLIAFGLGFMARQAWPAAGNPGDDNLVRDGSGQRQQSPAQRRDGRQADPVRQVAKGRQPPPSAAPAAAPRDDNSHDEIAGHLVLTQNPGEKAAISLPVRERLPDGPRQSPLPDYVRQQLERQGFRLDQRRGAMRMELTDGRWVEVPVDRVEVRYQGKHVY